MQLGPPFDQNVASISLSDRFIATGTMDHIVRLWSWRSPDADAIEISANAMPEKILLSPQANFIAFTTTTVDSRNEPVKRLRLKRIRGKSVDDVPIKCSNDSVQDFAFDAAERSMVIAQKKAVLICDTGTGDLIKALRDTANARIIAVSPDGRYVIVVGPQTTRLVRRASGKAIVLSDKAQSDVVAISPDSQYIASGEEKRVDIFNATDGSPKTSLSLGGYIQAMVFDPSSQHLTTASIVEGLVRVDSHPLKSEDLLRDACSRIPAEYARGGNVVSGWFGFGPACPSLR